MLARRPWYTVLYLQVLAAIVAGVLVGYFYPATGAALKPLGDGFIQLIKMMIAPVIFCTIVHGIATIGDLKMVGRVGIKTLLYFEVISTFALIIGLIVGELAQPGSGFNIDASKLDPKGVATYVTRAKEEGIVAHLFGIIPNSFFDAFAKGDLLQVLLIAILTGIAVSGMGELGVKISAAIDIAAQDVLPHHCDNCAGCPHWCLRRDGLHDWRLRPWIPFEPDTTHRDFLSDEHSVCIGGFGGNCPARRFFHLAVPCLH